MIYTGVIHLLEEPILPENKDFLKLDVRKALIGLNATKFTGLLENNGLGGYLDANEAYTVLAPPNEALDENTVPKNQIESWLKYHIVRGRYTPDDLADGQLLRSESSDHLGSTAKQRVYVHVTDQDRAIQSPIHVNKRSIQFDQASMIADPGKKQDSFGNSKLTHVFLFVSLYSRCGQEYCISCLAAFDAAT